MDQSSEDAILKLDGIARYTGLYLNGQSYYAAILKFGYELDSNWVFWKSAAGGPSKNVGQNAAYSLSVAYKLKKKNGN